MRDIRQRKSEFLSFDGAIRLTTQHRRPDRYRHLDEILDRVLIARGGGYSYSAASFGANSCVLEMGAFDRLLAFDPVKSTIKIEGGARLIDVMKWAASQGLQVPIVTGYPLITIGGCIAADVHGKNPWRDGTFSDWLQELTVFHPDKGYVTAPSAGDAALFDLTCGGFGLTGVIVDATLKLTTLPATELELAFEPVRNLSEAVAHLDRCTDDFCYSWHDAAATKTFGRGLVITGRWLNDSSRNMAFNYRPMSARTRAALAVSVWNSCTVRCANALFYQLNGRWRSRRRINFLEAAFPLARNAAYLAGFGRAGLREVQILLDATQIGPFIHALEELRARERPGFIMASLKRFKGRQRSLSPTGAGYLIAIDLLPGGNHQRIMAQLDDLMLQMRGQPNLSKDSRIARLVAARSIRNYATFSEELRVYDPARRFCSELSGRIGL